MSAEVVQFVPESELERARLIRQARAIYDGIFPTVDTAPAEYVAPESDPA